MQDRGFKIFQQTQKANIKCLSPFCSSEDPSIDDVLSFADLLGVQDRYRELLRTSRLWRNLKYRKWHGFGHSPDKDPGPGELALFCAACPQPGVNLPADWLDDPEQ